jgi:predicted aldo/keto reductase-like oxidoreductase
MKMVKLGQTDLVVSEMCVGTLTLGKLQANVAADQGGKAIRRAIDLGADFIDTAQSYGTYLHVAHAIRGVEKDLVVSSKSLATNYEDMEKAIYECRKMLRREVIDIFHLHLVSDEQDLNSRSWALKCILDFKEAGAVRAVGATSHTNAGLRAVADCPEIEVVMICVNEKGLGIVDGSLDECLELARVCRERGKAVLAMKPLAGGHLIGRTAEAINFVRGLEEVDAVAVGVLTPEEAEMDVRIFNDEEIPADLAEAVNKEPKRLIVYDKCVRCGRCVERCPQKALSRKGNKKPRVDSTTCILCGYCAEVCPEFAIRVV